MLCKKTSMLIDLHCILGEPVECPPVYELKEIRIWNRCPRKRNDLFLRSVSREDGKAHSRAADFGKS